MALSVKTSSGWRNASALVKVAGQWKEVSQLYVKQNGTWKPLWSYGWKEGAWSACSTTCGGGTQSREVTCQRSDGQPAAESLCEAVAKPESSQDCNTQACITYSWYTGGFASCTNACGDSVKTRTVQCRVTGTFTIVSDSFCEGEKPSATEPCMSCSSCFNTEEGIVNNKAVQMNATQYEGRTDWTAEEARAFILQQDTATPPSPIKRWWAAIGYEEKICPFGSTYCCEQQGYIYYL